MVEDRIDGALVEEREGELYLVLSGERAEYRLALGEAAAALSRELALALREKALGSHKEVD